MNFMSMCILSHKFASCHIHSCPCIHVCPFMFHMSTVWCSDLCVSHVAVHMLWYCRCAEHERTHMDTRIRMDATRIELVQMDTTRTELVWKDTHGCKNVNGCNKKWTHVKGHTWTQKTVEWWLIWNCIKQGFSGWGPGCPGSSCPHASGDTS